MENASKALIIAGAILLAILLISLGIMIYNQAQGVVDGSGMSEAEVQTFNAKFLKYEGKQPGAVVKSMVQDVMANNKTNTDKKITVNGNEPTVTSSIDNNTEYTVELVYTDGRVTEITY